MMNQIKITINDKEYNLLVASSEEEKEQGLMNVEEMDSDEGMLFDYSDDPEDELSFWMKDTSIPLDIIFVNTQNEVISVNKGEPESEDYITESNGPIKYVIELNQNSEIKPGDKLIFNDENIKDEDDEFDESSHPELEPNKLYVIGSDGKPQAELQGGERIFSRISSKVLINKAKKAYLSKDDKDYKALGKYLFKEISAQDNRPEEYV